MMSKPKKIGTSDAAVRYYIDAPDALAEGEKVRDDYYVNAQEPPGKWIGGGGIDGIEAGQEVKPEQWMPIMKGCDPTTGEFKLKSSSPNKKHTPGIDLTFSPDKSVSVLWAFASPEVRQKMEEAHEASVREAILFAADHAVVVRSGAQGKIHEKVGRENILAAEFSHFTSRDLDPQQHTHVVIANMQRCSDGTYRAIESRYLYDYQSSIANTYNANYAARLREIGCVVEVDSTGNFKLVGVPEDLCKDFSKRREDIEAYVEQNGGTGTRAEKQVATLATRKDKNRSITRAELTARWEAEAGERFTREMADRVARGEIEIPEKEFDPEAGPEPTCYEEFLDRQLYTESKTRSVLTEAQIFAAICKAKLEAGEMIEPESFDRLYAEAKASEMLICVGKDEKGVDQFAHVDIAITERSNREKMCVQTRHLAFDPAKVEAVIQSKLAEINRELAAAGKDPTSLKINQDRAIRHLLQSDKRVAVVEGTAGAGKSFMLQFVAEAADREGRQVHGIALGWEQALNLKGSAKLKAEAAAIEAWLSKAERGKLNLRRGDLVVIDEGGLCGARQFSRILRIAEEHDLKILIVGDQQQMKSIEAGSPLGDAVRFTSGINAVEMKNVEDIIRQDDHKDRQATLDFFNGKSKEAAAHYDKKGAIRLFDDRKTVVEQMTSDFLVTALDNIEREKENDPERKPRSQLMVASERETARLLNLKTQEKLREAGVLEGAGYRTRTHVDGVSREMTFYKGDTIQFRQKSDEMGVFNRTRGQIVALDEQHGFATVLLENGREIEVDLEAGSHLKSMKETNEDEGIAVQLGYASTITSAQGLTFDVCRFADSSNVARDSTGVAASRHREEFVAYGARDDLNSRLVAKSPDNYGKKFSDAELKGEMVKNWGRQSKKDSTAAWLADADEPIRQVANAKMDARVSARAAETVKEIKAKPAPAQNPALRAQCDQDRRTAQAAARAAIDRIRERNRENEKQK